VTQLQGKIRKMMRLGRNPKTGRREEDRHGTHLYGKLQDKKKSERTKLPGKELPTHAERRRKMEKLSEKKEINHPRRQQAISKKKIIRV